MNRKTILAVGAALAFFAVLGLAGAVEQGAGLSRMIFAIPALTAFGACARALI